MKLLFVVFVFFYSLSTNANTSLVESLSQNDKLIFIRHALAPGNGDPDNFDILDCTTQRNLDSVGRDQSKRLGKFFQINNIPINTILSSEWCRCQETAKLAFNKYDTFTALNSFYDPKFYNNKERQLDELKNFIHNLEEDGNIVFITHYVVIASMLGIGVSSGEILVTDRDLNVIGTIEDY
ncbi:histidine phosphatase family protein [Pelagibacteraceae bacterium]|nr:histidine phosphatase family protein [Pelagibacteraceae bacterium]